MEDLDKSNNQTGISRRRWCGVSASAALAGSALLGRQTSLANSWTENNYRYGLNMSTIRGQGLDAAEQIEIAGRAGYDSIEPWFRDIYQYVEQGGTLKDLKIRIDDHGLSVDSAIGFAKWIVNDPDKRKAGLEEAKRDMDTIAQLGGTRIAASPAGTNSKDLVSLDDAAIRYRELLKLGDSMGVIPQIEMWGGNPVIGTVEKAIYVAMASGHQKACFLGDVYHTYKGGSSFASLLQLGPHSLQTFHMNDYPVQPPRDQIKDKHRVFPGDGVAPLTEIFGYFDQIGAKPVLSLELFNPEYWKMRALDCAKLGLEKMRGSVAHAGKR